MNIVAFDAVRPVTLPVLRACIATKNPPHSTAPEFAGTDFLETTRVLGRLAGMC
ncbi:hypothetical protein WLZ34_01550 [Thermogladius sp. KZ2Tp1]|uniref:hypothetical protein n=1 Tax=Thermogladius sp. KZ2Tp1 TaxID=3136289 RepID=UPI003DA7FB10